MLTKIIKILTVVFITYLLIELVCLVFIKVKFTAAHFPSFKFKYDYKKYDFTIAEIDPIWGTWHYKEIYTERKQCFESVYYINSFGARDKERSKNEDTNRIIFLGDSFIEGYGLNEDQRLTNQLEKLTNKPVLNFGCGYFTPTQEYLVYKNLAKDFSHNTVIIGILPFNDLVEDDTSFTEHDGFVHYQPYFQGNYPAYNLFYRKDDISRSTFNKEGYYALQNSNKARTTRFLKEFTFWYNIFQFVKSNKPVMNENKKPYSGYYDCTQIQLNKLCFIIDRLKEEAAGRHVVMVAIPVYNDFERYKKDPSSIFSMKMDSFCSKRQIEYIDLLPALNKKINDPGQLYFSCDGHWNAAANKMAAEIILSSLRK